MPEPQPASASKLDERLPLILLPLLAIAVVLPLILRGCSCGHDIDFHLISWYEAAQQLRHGILFPHWAYSPAWNAGEPRFIFYPPISWLLGELLALIYWPYAYIAFIVIALTTAGLAFHRLARPFASPNAALLAAALYMLNPYMLFTAYERSAYGELLAATWICLLLRALLREKPTATAIAAPIALLWLTNVPAALIGCYTLAAVVLIRFLHGWITTRRAPTRALFTAAHGVLLGICLSGIYLIPAIWEGRWVQTSLATLNILLPQNNTLFHHTGDLDHDAVLRTASKVAVILIAFALVTLLTLWLTRRRATASTRSYLFPTLLLLTAGILFLLSPLSYNIWPLLPELSFLQFSWRLLIVLGPITALALAILFTRVPLGAIRAGMTIALAAFIIIPVSIGRFRQSCDPEDTPIGLRGLMQDHTGFDQTDEYTPNGADNDALQHGNPNYWLAVDPAARPETSDDDTSPVLPPNFLVESPQKQFLILNLRDYPAWRVRVNGELISPSEHQHRDDGLIAVPIVAGLSAVNLSYANTGDITLGRILSLLALIRFYILLDRRPRFADLSSAEQ